MPEVPEVPEVPDSLRRPRSAWRRCKDSRKVELSKHCGRQKDLCRQIWRSFFEVSCRLVLSDGSRTKGREPGQSRLAKLLPP